MASTPIVDERLKSVSLTARLMKRPELGALAGLILVTVFFVAAADPVMFSLSGVLNFLSPAAQLGIPALGAALLMIGGEFDLSIGSMVAFTGLIFGTAVTVLGLPPILALALTLTVTALCGFVNGQVAIRSGLPPFIVTHASLFILRGLSLVGLKWATGGSTQMRGIREAAGDIDAALICTPTDTHAELIQRFARAGKGIFCEKPVDLSLAKVQETLRVVKATGATLMVGFNRRFDPHFGALKAAIDEGRIGKVEMAPITSRDPGAPPVAYIERSGGLFGDMPPSTTSTWAAGCWARSPWRSSRPDRC